jgi:putative FmdB family regulatory protein
MPIFEYQCPDCQRIQEELLNRDEFPEVKCNACGTPMSRVPSRPNHKYLGYGFYATDYPKHFCKADKDAELKRLGKPLVGEAT